MSWMLLFANRVNVSNQWKLVQALAHTPVLNYDMPLALRCDYFDQWFITKKGWTIWLDNGHNRACTMLVNMTVHPVFFFFCFGKIVPIVFHFDEELRLTRLIIPSSDLMQHLVLEESSSTGLILMFLRGFSLLVLTNYCLIHLHSCTESLRVPC